MTTTAVTPKRIQRKRTAGWRMPADAVYVGRPGKWGNPYLSADPAHAVDRYRAALTECLIGVYRPTTDNRLRRRFGNPDDLRFELRALRGRDLACWCRLDQPCHADVLLEFAAGVDL